MQLLVWDHSGYRWMSNQPCWAKLRCALNDTLKDVISSPVIQSHAKDPAIAAFLATAPTRNAFPTNYHTRLPGFLPEIRIAISHF